MSKIKARQPRISDRLDRIEALLQAVGVCADDTRAMLQSSGLNPRDPGAVARLVLDLDRESHHDLGSSVRPGEGHADAVRRALKLLSVLTDAVRAGGSAALVDADGRTITTLTVDGIEPQPQRWAVWIADMPGLAEWATKAAKMRQVIDGHLAWCIVVSGVALEDAVHAVRSMAASEGVCATSLITARKVAPL